MDLQNDEERRPKLVMALAWLETAHSMIPGILGIGEMDDEAWIYDSMREENRSA